MLHSYQPCIFRAPQTSPGLAFRIITVQSQYAKDTYTDTDKVTDTDTDTDMKMPKGICHDMPARANPRRKTNAITQTHDVKG